MRFRTCCLLLCLLLPAALAEPDYHSPYAVKYDFPISELIGDLDGTRGEGKNQSKVGFQEWYSPEVRKRFGSWGPPSLHFPSPAGAEQKTAEWKRQRVVATALRYQGYHYQHHHIPEWDPPVDWPYKASPLGHQSKGVDCSNLTAFVYNLALGLKPTGDVVEQSRLTEVPGPGAGQVSKVRRIDAPADHADFPSSLKTGDLLFIRGKEGGEVTHVVLWVGRIGQSRTSAPLFIDSTGGNRKDEDGREIPDGVQLRQFAPGSWYYRNASHALRLIRDE
jgi:hypothetical protein